MTLPLEVTVAFPDTSDYKQPTGLFINNEFVPSTSNIEIQAINPTTGEIITSVHAANENDVDIAVKAARKAFTDVWSQVPPTEKGKLLFNLATLIEQNAEVLAKIECLDSGKPLYTNALADIEATADLFRYYAGWCDKSFGKTIDISPTKYAYVLYEPYGVVGQIIPWNYPIAMAGWKLGPALAGGNTVVLKTAEQTPLSMLYLAKLFVKAGFPPGVVNIISGYGPTAGAALASHIDVDKVAFTGSTATGKIIQALAASNLKAVTLECGGKSPMLIFDDADLDQAIKWTAFGIMYNMGQNCTANSRVYVQEGVYQKFVEGFKEFVMKEYKVNDPFAKDTTIGPLVTKQQQERVLSYINIGIEEGATLFLGGGKPSASEFSKGWFVEPTIFTNVNDNMRIMKEEIFGPVVGIASFKSEEEVLERANKSSYGLGSAIFTNDIKRAHNMARKIQAGMVYINSSNDEDHRIPFGGVKLSGVGRELGPEGISMYTQAKSIHVNLGSSL